MQRVVDLEGCFNFRDLGGYPTVHGRTVRWQRVYRSDALHLLTPADIARVQGELGLGAVIDLRSTAELRAEEAAWIEPADIHFHHVPLYDGERMRTEDVPPIETLADRYFLLAEFAKPQIARVVQTIAEANGPVVYHCAAGKDRTGVVSAVLLGLLGVRDEIIVADYAATRDNLEAIIDRLMESKGYENVFAALPPDTLHAEPATMITFLERLRAEHGSMTGYARAAGITPAIIDALAERLLED
jgi:protein-tyrosine phosphatase